MKKRLLIIATVCFLTLIVILFSASIFQLGNPLPYINKMFLLNNSNRYQKVFANKDIYITKRHDFSVLQKYIENTYDVAFSEQMGGGYTFTSDKAHILVTSTIFWRCYTVWELTFLE